MIDNIRENYPGEKVFGITLINEHEYLFTYKNDNVIENFLFNASKIQKMSYTEVLNYNKSNRAYSQSNYSIESENSKNSKNNENNRNSKKRKDNKNNEKSNSQKSGKNIITGNKSKSEEVSLSFFKGAEFENNSYHLIKALFNLDDLPNYFFSIGQRKSLSYSNNEDKKVTSEGKKVTREDKKDTSEDKKVTFEEYNNSLFSCFMETDGAFINSTNKILTPKDVHPFQVNATFEIKKNSLEGRKFDINFIEENFIIDPNSIIISETKQSIPKRIDEFNFNYKYNKVELDQTLIFTLNKLIKKIEIYSQFVENEILQKSQKIEEYKFMLLLIYNNIPVCDLKTVIEDNLILLNNKKYLKHEFKLKIIYLIPGLGSYNISRIQKDLNKMEEKFANEMKLKDAQILKLKNDIIKIQESEEEEIKKLKDEMKQIKLLINSDALKGLKK